MTPDQWTRSTACSTGACAEVRYTRSTACSSGTCVEVACRCDDGVVRVRDSKLADSPVLAFDPRRWMEFIDAVKGAGL